MPKIDLLDVTKSFRSAEGVERDVLRDLNLTVEDGEILAVVGASGSGKTTLLNILAGLDRPTTGAVTIDETPLHGLNTHAMMVFQTDAVFPFLRVDANVGYGVEDAAHRTDIVSHYLASVGLSDSARRWPRELSVGMRKRIEVARAYARRAPILLMDEPFGALDVLTKEAMQVLLLALWSRERRTILFVTHDVEEAVFVAHRVLVLAPSYPVVEIPFTFPRSPHLKLTPAFIDLRRQVTEHLSDGTSAPAVPWEVAWNA